jgi:nicotinate-nucleotide adenylyltransferase
MKRIGVFGGTFDPIHFGHLRPALELRDVLGLDEVRFIPSRVPPHRVNPRTPPDVRAEMVARAIEAVPGFVLDERELNRDGPSFTVDTLAELHREEPGSQLILILGMDAFLGLAGWHRPERVFNMAHMVVTHRPGWKADDSTSQEALIRGRERKEPKALIADKTGLVLFVEVTQLEISATAVRITAAAGGDIRYLVPEVVREYIEKNGCYRNI